MARQTRRRQRCRSCGADILFLNTTKGKWIPVDVDSIKIIGATLFDPKTMIAHFATCPNAKEHRKEK
jgi:hypothetical protein